LKLKVSALTFCLTIILFFGLTGCAPTVDNPADRKLRLEANDCVNRIKRGMENENINRIMGVIHPDYSPSEADLRADLRDVFSERTQIELDFYAVNFNRANGEMNLSVSWNLRWNKNSQIELRKGKTTFKLKRNKNDRLMISSQAGDILLGKLNPGRAK
jgi:hypothetical protein